MIFLISWKINLMWRENKWQFLFEEIRACIQRNSLLLTTQMDCAHQKGNQYMYEHVLAKRPSWVVFVSTRRVSLCRIINRHLTGSWKCPTGKGQIICPCNELFFLFQCNNSSLHEQMNEGIISMYLLNDCYIWNRKSHSISIEIMLTFIYIEVDII